jgi:hypothetical protein
MSVALIGPGVDGLGVASIPVDQAAWAANSNVNLYLDKGTKGGTLLGHRLQLALAYSGAPANLGFTDEEMRAFKSSVVTNLRVSSKLGPMVTSQSTGLAGGEIDLINRVVLRQVAGGNLDASNGLIAIGATGILLVEIPLVHLNPITGMDHCPDLRHFQNLQMQVALGSAGPTLAGTTITITAGTLTLWCDYMPYRPGADSHLRWDTLLQNSATDTLPSQQRLGLLVTGSTVPTYTTAINDLGLAPPDFAADVYQFRVGGVDVYATDGYLNNALVWSEAIRRSRRGTVSLPGADRYGVEAGFGSYAVVPLYIPNFEAINDSIRGEVVVQNAPNLAATSRTYASLIVQRAGC